MPLAATTEAHERFKPFEGTFRAEVKIWMGGPEPMVSTGTMVNTLDLGGRFITHRYTGDPSDGPFPDFEGRGFWGFNTATNKYEGVWIDTASTIIQTEQGDVDESGRIWTMIGELPAPMGGGEKRSIITLQDDDHHRMEMFFTGPDGKDIKGMEINYTRQA